MKCELASFFRPPPRLISSLTVVNLQVWKAVTQLSNPSYLGQCWRLSTWEHGDILVWLSIISEHSLFCRFSHGNEDISNWLFHTAITAQHSYVHARLFHTAITAQHSCVHARLFHTAITAQHSCVHARLFHTTITAQYICAHARLFCRYSPVHLCICMTVPYCRYSPAQLCACSTVPYCRYSPVRYCTTWCVSHNLQTIQNWNLKKCTHLLTKVALRLQ